MRKVYVTVIQKQQNQALQLIVQRAKPHSGMTEARGIGKPMTFKREEKKYPEWKTKLMAFMKVTIPHSDEWIARASKSKDVLTENLI